IAVDGAGDAFVAGWGGADYPVTAGAYQTTALSPPVLGLNGFLTKLNPSGSAQVYSTFVGGSAFIQYLYVAVDAAGAAYLAGVAGSSFPVTAGAYQTVFGGGIFDAFVAKLNPAGSALVYSTFLGGPSYEMAQAIAVDSSGCAYVTGNTRGGFPVTAGAYDTVSGGGSQVFVSKLNASGSALVYSTYAYGDAIGGSSGSGIAVDAAGNAYVTGGAGLSVIVPIPVSEPPPPGEPNSMVLAFGLNADGSALAELGVNQTMIGANGGSSIALDPGGNIYVAGHSDGGIVGTGGVLQGSAGGHGCAFVCKFGGPLAYATATALPCATPSPSASPTISPTPTSTPTPSASPVASQT
ncbi:MAG TPA: SBBP repeat-containing protein, partial [bacterium]|nr:SBBP repeat-containing protein [bacterium]